MYVIARTISHCAGCTECFFLFLVLKKKKNKFYAMFIKNSIELKKKYFIIRWMNKNINKTTRLRSSMTVIKMIF